MQRQIYLSIILITLIFGGARFASAQNDGDQYFFYGKPTLAKRKLIPASELSLCALGDTFNPPIKKHFRDIVSVGAGSRSQMLETGRCDVAMIYGHPLERIKEDFRGFAIYQASGSSLKLAVEPDTGGWIAVGRMEFTGRQTLEKKDIAACGDGTLRELFRPNKRTWKAWSQNSINFENLKTPRDLEQSNVLLYGCDILILTPDEHKKFSKAYGAKYPAFDVTPDNPVLTKRK